MQSFLKLKVWEKAHAVTLDIYSVTRSFPKDELFGLTSQMRRASASIGANIAEGTSRKGDGEFGRFLYIAIGSASELEYHLFLHGIFTSCRRRITNAFTAELKK